MNWIIYVLKNPRTQEVRYVGWTSKSAEARLKEHIKTSAQKPNQTYRQKWIMSLVSIGLIPTMEIIESGTGDNWAEAERRWIAHYRANGARLANATDGGEGIVGLSPEVLSARARKRLANQPPDRQSAIVKKSWAGLTAEQRMARTDQMRAHLTIEKRRIAMAKTNAMQTPEQCRAAGKKGGDSRIAGLTPEELATSVARMRAGNVRYWEQYRATRPTKPKPVPKQKVKTEPRKRLTPEELYEKRATVARATIAKVNAGYTREKHQAAWAKLTPEEQVASTNKARLARSIDKMTARIRAINAARTTEQRKAAWVKRRLNAQARETKNK